jgi:hypothetical protein
MEDDSVLIESAIPDGWDYSEQKPKSKRRHVKVASNFGWITNCFPRIDGSGLRENVLLGDPPPGWSRSVHPNGVPWPLGRLLNLGESTGTPSECARWLAAAEHYEALCVSGYIRLRGTHLQQERDAESGKLVPQTLDQTIHVVDEDDRDLVERYTGARGLRHKPWFRKGAPMLFAGHHAYKPPPLNGDKEQNLMAGKIDAGKELHRINRALGPYRKPVEAAVCFGLSMGAIEKTLGYCSKDGSTSKYGEDKGKEAVLSGLEIISSETPEKVPPRPPPQREGYRDVSPSSPIPERPASHAGRSLFQGLAKPIRKFRRPNGHSNETLAGEADRRCHGRQCRGRVPIFGSPNCRAGRHGHRARRLRRHRMFGPRTAYRIGIVHKLTRAGLAPAAAGKLAGAFLDTPQSGRLAGGLFPIGRTLLIGSPDGGGKILNILPDESADDALGGAEVALVVDLGRIVDEFCNPIVKANNDVQ